MRFQTFVCIALWSSVLSLQCGPATADDFRVDSKIFVAKEATPHSTNITLFRGSHVYDFLDKPQQITIYDLERKRIVMLDPAHERKAEVSIAMLTSFCDTLERRPTAGDAFLKFAIKPTFDETTDKTTGEMLFASSQLTYRVMPKVADDRSVATRYREFSDFSAKLNALVNRGSLPPFPRLTVNAALAESGKVPQKILLTVPPRQLIGGHTTTLRSEHEFRSRILDSDEAKIDSAGELLGRAEAVNLSDYLRPPVASLEK